MAAILFASALQDDLGLNAVCIGVMSAVSFRTRLTAGVIAEANKRRARRGSGLV